MSFSINRNNVISAIFFILYSCLGSKSERFDIAPLGVLNPPPSWCNYTEKGTFLRLEVSGCVTPPCFLTPGNTYEMAPTFIPGFNTNTLRYGALFYPASGESPVSLRGVNVPGSHTAGHQYRINEQFVIPSSIAGKTGQIRIALLDPGVRDYISRCFDVLISH